MSRQASQNVLLEITKLVGKGVIEYTEHEKGEFILPIFFRSKSDGTRRLILNLKPLNEFLEYKHFKMERVHSVTDLIQPHCYMATIDVNDAYYAVKISEEEDSKYLKFYTGKMLLKFVVLPNALSSGPPKFTKLSIHCMFKNRRCYSNNIHWWYYCTCRHLWRMSYWCY